VVTASGVPLKYAKYVSDDDFILALRPVGMLGGNLTGV